MELTTREWASLTLLGSIVLIGVVLSKDRTLLKEMALDVLKNLVAWRVASVLLGYLLWAAAVVWGASWIGIWTADLLKETLYLVLIFGIPFLINAVRHEAGSVLLRELAKPALGLVPLLVAFINLAPFSYWGELALQFVLLALVTTSIRATARPTTGEPTVNLPALALGLIVIGLFIYTTAQVLPALSSFDWEYEARAYALSLGLPLALFPYFYAFAVVAASGSVLHTLKWQREGIRPPVRVRAAVIVGLRLSLRYAANFTGQWPARTSDLVDWRSTRNLLKEYRQSVRKNARERRTHKKRLRRQSGKPGIDADGLQLDRREFSETKNDLDYIFHSQMGQHRRREGRYQDEPIAVLPPLGREKIPRDTQQPVQIRVREDRQAWYCWRQTPSGYYLGVGSTGGDHPYWQYDGFRPPGDYPSLNEPGWRNTAEEDQSPEWATEDDLPRLT